MRRTLPSIALSICLLALIAGCNSTRNASLSQSKAVQAELQAIRKAGYPVTMQELDDWYPKVTPKENAARIYDSAFESLNEPSFFIDDEELSNLSPNKPLSPETLGKLKGHLKGNQKTLALLHQAAALKKCRYQTGFPDGWLSTLEERPDLMKFKRSISLINNEVLGAIEDQNPAQALAAINAGMRLAYSIDNEPTLLHTMMGVAAQGAAVPSANRLLSRLALSDEQLLKLAKYYSAEQIEQVLKRAAISERCFTLDVFLTRPEKFAQLHDDWSDLKQIMQSSFPKREADCLMFLSVTGELVAATELPFPKQLEGVKKAYGIYEKMNQNPEKYPLTGIGMPNWGRASHNIALNKSRLISVQIACAIERYRLAHQGALPDKLSGLTPKYLPRIPADPFNGKPMQYRKLGKNSYEIQSVGRWGTRDIHSPP